MRNLYRKIPFFMFCGALGAMSFYPAFSRAETQKTKPASDAQMAALWQKTKENPAALQRFLKDFPKGSDLHNHLIGAVYAESFLDWAAADGNCLSIKKKDILPQICGKKRKNKNNASFLKDHPALRDQFIDAMSMRHFKEKPRGETGHDHFFQTFGHVAGIQEYRAGDAIAQARQQAAADKVQYLELMITPDLSGIKKASESLKPFKEEPSEKRFKKWQKALSPKLDQLVAAAEAEIDQAQSRNSQLLNCQGAHKSAGCGVNTRYLYQALRFFSPQEVFTQLAVGYALAAKDPRVVGVNLVAPEDNPVATRDYTLHMQMFRFFGKQYPKVHLSLHAGELTSALVKPEALRSHIRQAIEIAGAERIGHGIDIKGEDQSEALLKEMAKKHILVEINLTSNDEILHVTGKAHPFWTYWKAGVPLTLSSDDEGISRGSLTQEYVRAVQDQGVSYPQLKILSRTGLDHGFLEGKSLWRNVQKAEIVPVCKKAFERQEMTPKCQKFLEKNEKAKLEWALEQRIQLFEKEQLSKAGR